LITINERLIIINGLFLIDFMECFGTTDFDNNSRLITLPAIIISGLYCTMNTPKFSGEGVKGREDI
jgi:hypothetical protein